MHVSIMVWAGIRRRVIRAALRRAAPMTSLHDLVASRVLQTQFCLHISVQREERPVSLVLSAYESHWQASSHEIVGISALFISLGLRVSARLGQAAQATVKS